MRRVGYYAHPVFLLHDAGPGHPERPQRLEAIAERLKRDGLWDHLAHRKPQAAARDVLALAHPPEQIARIEEACRSGPTWIDADTYAVPQSWEAALCAVGAATAAVDELFAGTLDAAFCAARPPGHHASADTAMGFCLFNQAAVAARYAQQRYGCGRVLIVDWDVHHGNGTQEIFYRDPSVFYFSTHQWPFYPGTGSATESGEGPGSGSTLNVPLAAGSGDAEIDRALDEQLSPRMRAFSPELVVISAGFDAHQADPLASLQCTEAGYARFTQLVRGIAAAYAGGRVLSVLEGGYDLEALGGSVDAHLRALLE